MKLSIIIVNYNTAEITLQCIKSLEKFPFKEKHEVILVDNASTDSSDKLVSKYKSKIFNYLYIKNKSNLGFSKANNIGIKKSKGKYKLLLNSDTKVTKNALNILVETAQNYKDAGIIAPRLLNKDKSIQASVFNLPTIWRSIKAYWFNDKILSKYYLNKFFEVESAVFAAVLLTPIALKKVGLMNEKYFMYFEDLDYCRELGKKNLKIYYQPDSQIYHLHGASGGGDWKRLIPSSKIYHGTLRHYVIFLITWLGQKFSKIKA